MILTDAGPLVAIIDRGERDHGRCRKALQNLTGPMLTTWPAFTEAMHILGGSAGWPGQEPLWRLVRREDLQIAQADLKMISRMSELMERYRNVPMDLADASLVTLAEARGLTRIFTLDTHFRIYRAARSKVFTLIP